MYLITLALAKLSTLGEPLTGIAMLAQDAGTPDASSVISSLITSSPFAAAMAYFAVTERSHNRELEKQHATERREWDEQRVVERVAHEAKLAESAAAYLALLKEALPVFSEGTSVLKEVQEAMTEQVRAAQRRGVAPEFEGKLNEMIELLRAKG